MEQKLWIEWKEPQTKRQNGEEDDDIDEICGRIRRKGGRKQDLKTTDKDKDGEKYLCEIKSNRLDEDTRA